MELSPFYLRLCYKNTPRLVSLLLKSTNVLPSRQRNFYRPGSVRLHYCCIIYRFAGKCRFDVVPSSSIQPSRSVPSNTFDIILHEVFGFIASSEGCAISVGHARRTYCAEGGVCLPSRAASLFTLCSMSPQVENTYFSYPRGF